jgi:hypothetical protein
MKRAALLAIVALSIVACDKGTDSQPQPLEDTVSPAAETITPIQPAHACDTDADCLCSCTYGAVNVSWYRANVDETKECKDGCAAKGSVCTCEDGSCVAHRLGEANPGCTRRDVAKLL